MEPYHYFLGQLNSGRKFSVKSSQTVLTVLIDEENLRKYTQNIPYQSQRTIQNRQPDYQSIPHTAKWHLFIIPLQSRHEPTSTIYLH